METKYTTAGREWKVGERVIVVSTSSSSVAPRVRPIESVAEQSFVVDGDRYRKDGLRDGLPCRYVGTGWGRYSVSITPLDAPAAPLLLAERALYKQWRQVHSAQTEWDRIRTVDTAESLRAELAEWIEARKALDTVTAETRGR